IDDNAHAFEGQPFGKGCLGELDVTAQGIIDAHRLADFTSGRPNILDFAAEYQLLDLVFDVVVELVAVSPKEFDAIIVIGIMRSGDDDARIRAKTARDVSNA